MLQVKIFKNLEFQYDELAAHVNEWIRESRVDVVDIRVQLSPQSPGEGASLGAGGRRIGFDGVRGLPGLRARRGSRRLHREFP